MRAQLVLCCLVPLILPGGGLAQGSASRTPASSCERPTSEDAITTISTRGELGLASGRSVRLLDVRLPSEEDEFREPLAWLQSLAGRRIRVAALAVADRWGRITADVALLDEPAPIDLAELLVAEGWAMVDAGERNVLCRPELLAG